MSLISNNFWHSIVLKHITSNVRQNKSPNLWLFARETSNDISIVCVDLQQMITVEFSMLNARHRITFVYASVFYQVRRQLWNSILSIYANWNDPYLVIRDFNAVLGAHEKTGNPPLSIS